MFRQSAQALACAALLGVTVADAAGGSIIIARSVGEVSYPASRYGWEDAQTSRFLLGYDLADLPVSFEFAMMESGTSTYDYFAVCGCEVSIDGPEIRKFSALQLAAGYRLWTHRRTGTGLVLRGGLYDADSTIDPITTSKESFSNRGYFLGVAGTLMVLPAFGVRVEWEYFDGLEDIERHDASLTWAGLILKFGGYPPFFSQ